MGCMGGERLGVLGGDGERGKGNCSLLIVAHYNEIQHVFLIYTFHCVRCDIAPFTMLQ